MSETILTLSTPEVPGLKLEVTQDQVTEFRRVMLTDFARGGGDVSKISRKNEFYVPVDNAVSTLDAAGFWSGQSLDERLKRGHVVWLSRALRGIKKRYSRYMPVFIEVF
jgi:hypothetical protein